MTRCVTRPFPAILRPPLEPPCCARSESRFGSPARRLCTEKTGISCLLPPLVRRTPWQFHGRFCTFQSLRLVPCSPPSVRLLHAAIEVTLGILVNFDPESGHFALPRDQLASDEPTLARSASNERVKTIPHADLGSNERSRS